MCAIMARPKKGRDLLLAYIRAQRKPGAAPPGFVFSLTAFAKAIGVSRQVLRLWMLGAVKPDAAHRRQLFEASCESARRGAARCIRVESWE